MQQDRADLSDNPFLKIDNPYEEQQLRDKQDMAAAKASEFQRLCYSVFHEYADGKRLWEMFNEMYLMTTQLNPAADNANTMSIWWDGFKACGLGFYNHGLAHIKRTNGVG